MKQLLIYIVGLSLSLSLCEAQALETYMTRMVPSSTQLKVDMLNQLIQSYKEKKGESKVVSLYRDTCRLIDYEENNYAFFQTSSQGYVSAKLWKIDDSLSVYGFSSWVCGSMCDGWWRVQTSGRKAVVFPEIGISDFFDKDSLAADGLDADTLASRFEMVFLHCEFSKGDSVHIYCDTERYLEKERKKRYAKYFKGNRVSLLPIDGSFRIVAVKRDERFNEAH
ncbi:MAG: hypothetical protein J6T28_07460 [Paludibacteraceae bacterium]|nr:hypothetical protein [Paludibacteraceae bacterium]